MAAQTKTLARTALHLLPPVLGAVALSIGGLAIVRHLVDPVCLVDARETLGSNLQTLGSVYSVLLAFVVYVVWQQFNEARQNVEKEATELVDLYRTACGLRDPARACLHRHLERYVDTVLEREWPAMARNDEEVMGAAASFIDRAWDDLHPHAPDGDGERTVYAAALARLNDLSDARSLRLDSARARIPAALRLLLYAGAFMVVGSTWLLPAEPFALHAVICSILAGALSHVLYVIEDLDDCFDGDWQVSAEPFVRARAYMTRPRPAGVSSGPAC